MTDAQRMRELFDEASALDETARTGFLAEECAGSPELREAVEKLLRADREAESATLWRFPALHAEAKEKASAGSLAFTEIGPYRVVARLGSGGMGAVYLAEQDLDGISRKVAIKVIPRALADEEMVRRFRQERQILARLEHPNIARMLDAGQTPDGLPYLVMEYVEGVPIDRYAAGAQLTLKGRVALFEAVCDAVVFAHRNLIVHRDLKPGNILVTSEGVPKLLDFGIAKLLSDAVESNATRTLAMTPGYASPEQLSGGPITTATDIYSLGILLYELAAGEKRNATRKTHAGDIDTVIAMATRAEPERRYPSAADLADDARRAAGGYPVRARPDTFTYRLRRLISRRPIESAALLAMAGALIIAVVVAYAQYRQARARFDEVRAVANSFLFDVYDALGDLPGTTPARMLLARRAQQYLDTLERDRSADPALRTELAASYVKLGDILGRPYSANLGDTAGALANYEKAAALYQSIDASGRGSAALYQAWAELYGREVRMSLRRGLPDDAVTAGEKSTALMDRAVALKASSRDIRLAAVDSRVYLGIARLEVAKAHGRIERYRKAEAEASLALDRARAFSKAFPSDDAVLAENAKALQYLAYIEHDIGRYTGDPQGLRRAIDGLSAAVTIMRSLYEKNPSRYKRTMADMVGDLGRGIAEADGSIEGEVDSRQSVHLFGEIAAADPQNMEGAGDLVIAHFTLAKALAARGNVTEAKAEFQATLAGHERIKHQIPYEESDNTLIVDTRDWLAGERLRAGIARALWNITARISNCWRVRRRWRTKLHSHSITDCWGTPSQRLTKLSQLPGIRKNRRCGTNSTRRDNFRRGLRTGSAKRIRPAPI